MIEVSQVRTRTEGASSEQLVAIRPAVLNEVEHALGNLFQRMYHVTRAAREELGPYAERLTATVEDLERLLELVFEYVTPLDLDLKPVRSELISESLRAQFGAAANGAESEGIVLADVRVLGRAFRLLADTLRGGAKEFEVRASIDSAQQRIEWAMIPCRQAGGAQVSVPERNLARAVAARLIELHGGEVAFGPAGVLTITLPSMEG